MSSTYLFLPGVGWLGSIGPCSEIVDHGCVRTPD